LARGIDHLVLAARDLDHAATIYKNLGFTVGARNRHPWGTLNHIVQLDGSFLELITTEAGFAPPDAQAAVQPFAGFLHDYLARREGLAMLVLDSADAASDGLAFAKAGIGLGSPFFFERKGRRAGGEEVHVAFTLAFARTPHIRDAGFFVCQQHYPEAFWSPALQSHANTAVRIAAVTMLASAPHHAEPFLAEFAGVAPDVIDGGLAFETARGRIEVLTREACCAEWGPGTVAQTPQSPLSGPSLPPSLVGFRVVVTDLGAARAALERGGVAHHTHERRLIVPAAAAAGTAIAFEAT
jgi:hypothetical protein